MLDLNYYNKIIFNRSLPCQNIKKKYLQYCPYIRSTYSYACLLLLLKDK